MASFDEIRADVNSTIIDVLDIDDLAIDETTTAGDIDGWDSLAHVRIMMALERKFGFRWEDEEIGALKRVGDIYDTILKKQS